MTTQKSVKPHTTDCYGNSFYAMSTGQLIELRDAINVEIRTYSFYRESIRYQKKQRATLDLLCALTAI